MKAKKILPLLITVLALSNVTTYASEYLKGNAEFTPLTQEERQISQEKSKLAEQHAKTKGYGSTKINSVGKFEQEKYYTCGPAAAKNLVNGYAYANGLSVPSEYTFEKALGTTKDGTGFGPNWTRVLNQYAPGNNYTRESGNDYPVLDNWIKKVQNSVIWTIDKSKNYNVIANLYHDPAKASWCVNDVYANKQVAHYVTIYGYTPNGVYISDSNQLFTDSTRTYYTGNWSMGYTTQARGIVW